MTSSVSFRLEEGAEVLGVVDDVFTVAQDPLVCQVFVSDTILGEHLHAILDLLDAILANPVSIVTLNEILKDGEPLVGLGRVGTHLDQLLNLVRFTPLGPDPQHSRENILGQLREAARIELSVLAHLQNLTSDIVSGVHVCLFVG